MGFLVVLGVAVFALGAVPRIQAGAWMSLVAFGLTEVALALVLYLMLRPRR